MKGFARLSQWLALEALLLLGGPCLAQVVRSSALTLRVPRLCQLLISGDVSGLLTLSVDGSGESSFDQGYAASAADATVLTINANDSWDLSARLNGGWNCPGTYDKDENDLMIRVSNTPVGTIQNGADQYINLADTDTQILSHDSAVADNTVNIQTKVLLDWTQDVPGTYDVTVTYTLVTHLP